MANSPTTVSLRAASPAKPEYQVLLRFAGSHADFQDLGEPIGELARQTARRQKFGAQPRETLLLPFTGGIWLLAGLGAAGDLQPVTFAEAVGKATAELQRIGAPKIHLALPADLPWGDEEAARLAGEAIQMATYRFDAYRNGKGGGKSAGAPLQVTVSGGARPALARGLAESAHAAAGVALARDLINTPAGDAHTTYLAGEARRVAKALGAKFRLIQGDQLLRQGYHAIHTVGRAAENPPALAVLEYGQPRKNRPTLALVGKGVTFDTGGLDIKPSSSMALMKKDMGGAAIVLGAFRAIAGRKLPIHLVAVLGLAENAVDAASYRPGDIVRTKAGPTVEITNTDAEGRVVLADALALARQYKPTHMVDFATLTGACRVALGRDLMGLFCDDDTLRGYVEAAARTTGEAVWRLPLWQPYRKLLDSNVADMVNSAPGGLAGAITAALFLKDFAGDVAWAHLDCYAWSEGEHPLFPKGGSGAGVRLCVELARYLAEGP